MMLCGQQVIDVDDWRSNTDYDGYTKDSGVVVWFWEHLKTLPQ